MHVNGVETQTPPKKKKKKKKKRRRRRKKTLNLSFETTPTEQVSKHRLLGVTVDEQLNWQTHINICRTVSRNVFLLLKLSQMVSHKTKLASSFLSISLFSTHYVTYKLCFKCMRWISLRAHEATVFSPQTCRKLLDANS